MGGKSINGLKGLITSKEASQISGYHPDYLSWLVRTQKLKGVKVGKNWFIDVKDLQKYCSGQVSMTLKDFLFSNPKRKILVIGAMIFAAFLTVFLIGYLFFDLDFGLQNKSQIRQLEIENEIRI